MASKWDLTIMPRLATVEENVMREMNVLVSALYPKECKHDENDLKRSMCCLFKIRPPNDDFSIANVTNFAKQNLFPIVVPELTEQMANSDIRFVSLLVKIVKLENYFVLPVVIVRYFTWQGGIQIRVLDLNPLDALSPSEEDISHAVVAMVDQMKLLKKIVSIDVDPKSCCESENLRSKLCSEFQPGDFFRLDLKITDALINLFEDIAKQMPFDLTAILNQFKSDPILDNFELLEPEQGYRETVMMHVNKSPQPILPNTNCLLQFRPDIMRLAIYYEILKDFCQDKPHMEAMRQYTSCKANEVFLLNFSQIAASFVFAIHYVQQDSATLGHALDAILVLKKAMTEHHDNFLSVQGIENLEALSKKRLSREEKTRFITQVNNFFNAFNEKIDQIIKDIIGPFDWILLQTRPNPEQVLKSLDYFTQHDYPLREIDLTKLEKEIETVRNIIRKQLIRWNDEGKFVLDRWNKIVNQGNNRKELAVLLKLVEFIFTAIPLGVNKKVHSISEDIELFWTQEVKRNGKNASWMIVKTALMMRHNLGEMKMSDAIALANKKTSTVNSKKTSKSKRKSRKGKHRKSK